MDNVNKHRRLRFEPACLIDDTCKKGVQHPAQRGFQPTQQLVVICACLPLVFIPRAASSPQAPPQ
jgi:hypothetical protein